MKKLLEENETLTQTPHAQPPTHRSGGGPEFNLQSRTVSYQRRYKNGTSSSIV